MRTSTRRAAAVTAVLAALFAFGPEARSGASPWAPARTAPIHPGVQTVTAGGQCTANFVFTATAADGSTDVFIGQAAHCASTGGQSDVNGCNTGSLPLGTPVSVGGATRPGVLAYSSWLTMQQRGETSAAACEYNDLALVRLDPADVGRVNPSIPVWGGPNGVSSTSPPLLWKLYSYGNSELRAGVTLLSPKIAYSLGDEGGGWSHDVSTVTPGIPGDSGSAYLDSSGRALGVLSTIQIGVPGGLSNGVGDIGRELVYARSYGAGLANLALVDGDVPFNGNQLPLDLTHPVS